MTDELKAKCAAAWSDILARIADGGTIEAACKAHGLAKESLRQYRAGNPQLMQAWEDARLASADSFFEEAMAVARDPHIDVVVLKDEAGEPLLDAENRPRTQQVRRYADSTRVLVDTLKWAAAKRNPRVYNDKSSIDVNVKTVDLTAIIRDANARLAAAKHGQIIDGTYNRVPEATDAHAQTLLAPDLAALL